MNRQIENPAANKLAEMVEACLYSKYASGLLSTRGPLSAPGAYVLSQPPEVRDLLKTLKSEDFAKMRIPEWLEGKRSS